MANENITKFSWEYKEINKKNWNASQWPFAYIRKANGLSSMECRSITKLDESFKGSGYSLDNTLKVLNRYELLKKVFSKFKIETLSNITHLIIDFNTIYYKVKDSNEIGNIIYFSDNVDNENTKKKINYLANYYLVKNNFYKDAITDIHKKFNLGYFSDISLLKDCVFSYIASRKKMAKMNEKTLISVIKELPFTSLEYFVFLDNSIDTFNFSREVENKMAEMTKKYEPYFFCDGKYYVDTEKINVAKENEGLNAWARDLVKGKEPVNKLCRVYYAYLTEEYLEKKNYAFTLFNSLIKDKKLSGSNIGELFKSEREIIREQKEEEERKALYLKMKKIKANIVDIYAKNRELIYSSAYLVKQNDILYNKLQKEGNIEFDIWGEDFSISHIANRMNAVNRVKINSKSNHEFDSVSIINYMKYIYEILGSKDDLNADIKELSDLDYQIINSIIPTGFKNDTLKYNKYSISDVEDLKELLKVGNIVNKVLIETLEILLGVEFAIFGRFMNRYGLYGIDLSKLLVPNLIKEDEKFYITENILENANKAFYFVYQNDLDCRLEDCKDLTTEVINEKLGGYNNFVMTYLSKLRNVEKLVMSDSNSIYNNLQNVIKGIQEILNQCFILQGLDSNSVYILMVNNAVRGE